VYTDGTVVNQPLFSIITVCLNAQEFIEQCIQSVLSQEFDDFEYIIIDGGSTDGTVEIIRKYQNKLAYWHSKPDRGLAHAFNLGVEHSSGQWVGFLNSDDYYINEQVLSTAARTLNGSNADVVYGQVQFVERNLRSEFSGPPYGDDWRWSTFSRRSTIPHPASFTSRGFIESVGKFDEKFSNALDYELYLRKGDALRTFYIPSVFACMRTGGMSHRQCGESLRQSYLAQIKNGARTTFTAVPVYAFYLLRAYLGRAVRKLFSMSGHSAGHRG